MKPSNTNKLMPAPSEPLEERNKELSILLSLSNLMSRTLCSNKLLDDALSMILEYFPFSGARIYLLEDNEEYLTLAAHKGIDPSGLERIHISQGFTGRAARTKQLIAYGVDDLDDLSRTRMLKSRGFQSILCVPMILEDKLVGIINLASGDEIRLEPNFMDLLVAVANQIAIAIDRARIVENLQSLVEELREKNKTIELFAYSISHDLKSPAIALHGLTSLLGRKYYEILGEKGKTYCDQILKVSEQMVNLLEQLTKYINAKESTFQTDRISLQDVLDSLRYEFAQRLADKQVSWVQPAKLPEIRFDKVAITRVFRNLIDNSLKYGGDELSSIEISCEEEGDHHKITFHDNGVGIPEEGLSQIFKPFQRLSTSKDIEGTGLGLSIIKEIIERNGGTLTVASEYGKGASFHIVIPR